MIYKDDEGYEYVKFLAEVKEYLHEKNEYWWKEERKDLDLKYYVPTDIICEALAPYEVGIPKKIYDFLGGEKGYNTYFGDSFANYMEGHCVESFGGDNTYNHCGRPQNDINWETFKLNDDRFWVVLAFHIGGDIRGNYTNEIVLEFEYDTQFLEVLDEITSEYSLYFDLKVDNKIYELAPHILDECLEVYDRITDDYIYHIFGIDDEEVTEQIREQRKEIFEDEKNQINTYMLDNDLIIMAEHDNFLNEEHYSKEDWIEILKKCKEFCEKEIERKNADEELRKWGIREYDIEKYIDDIIIVLGGKVDENK